MCSVRQPQDRKLGGLRSASTLRNQQIVRGTTRRRLVDPNIVSWNPGSHGTDEQATNIGPTASPLLARPKRRPRTRLVSRPWWHSAHSSRNVMKILGRMEPMRFRA